MTARRSGARDAGFALPAVLVVTAMLALVFLTAVMALASLGGQTQRAKGRLAFEQAALSAEARLAFLAATRPSGPLGVELPADDRGQPRTLHLDGRPYRYGAAIHPLLVAAQDGAGQVNLNTLSPEARARLVAGLDLPGEAAAALADRWADYLDPDGLKRVNGAEAGDYLAAGLPPPPNRALIRTAEISGLLGWRETMPRASWRSVRDLVRVDPISAAINVNTASPRALQILLGLDAAQARAVVEARRRAAFNSMAEVTRLVGPIPFDAERSYTRPDGRIALKVAARDRGLVFRARIVLSPDSPERPFWIEERGIAQAVSGETVRPRPDDPLFPDAPH